MSTSFLPLRIAGLIAATLLLSVAARAGDEEAKTSKKAVEQKAPEDTALPGGGKPRFERGR